MVDDSEAELIGLRIWDVDHARGTVFVRQGKREPETATSPSGSGRCSGSRAIAISFDPSCWSRRPVNMKLMERLVESQGWHRVDLRGMVRDEDCPGGP